LNDIAISITNENDIFISGGDGIVGMMKQINPTMVLHFSKDCDELTRYKIEIDGKSYTQDEMRLIIKKAQCYDGNYCD